MIRRNRTATVVEESTSVAVEAVDAATSADIPLRNPSALLGEILIDEGVITSEQLDEALAKRKVDGKFLGQSLVELGHIDQDALTLILVKQCKIPHLNLLEYQLDETIARLIPKNLCEQYRILPVDKMGKILTVAMVNPLNVDALDAIREQYPDLRVKPILCNWNHFTAVYSKIFDEKLDGGDAAEADEDTWEGLNIPKAPPKKPDVIDVSEVGAGGLGGVISEVLGTSAAEFIVGLLEENNSDSSAGEELADTLREGMEDRMPEIVQAFRNEIGESGGSAGVTREEFVELSKKIEALTRYVSQLADRVLTQDTEEETT